MADSLRIWDPTGTVTTSLCPLARSRLTNCPLLTNPLLITILRNPFTLINLYLPVT
jgi:hypothetical protein